MSTQENFFEESKKKVEEYVQDRLLLLKLEGVEKTSRLIATMSTVLLIALFAFLVILFISLTAGFLIGEWLHHAYWGFGIVAGIYVVLLVFVVVFRKKIVERRIINMVIDIFFESTKPGEKNKPVIKEETHEH